MMEAYAKVWNSHTGEWTKCVAFTKEERDEMSRDRRDRNIAKFERCLLDMKIAGIDPVTLLNILAKKHKRSKKFNRALRELV